MIPKTILVTTIILSGGCSSFKQPPGTRTMIAFEKPSAASGCIETYRDPDISSPIRGYNCADGQAISAKVKYVPPYRRRDE